MICWFHRWFRIVSRLIQWLSGRACRLGLFQGLSDSSAFVKIRLSIVPNKNSLYAVVMRPGDDWVDRNVVNGGKQTRLRTGASSAMSETAGNWSIIKNSGRLGCHQEWMESETSSTDDEFGCKSERSPQRTGSTASLAHVHSNAGLT